jgi:hypothetical protein
MLMSKVLLTTRAPKKASSEEIILSFFVVFMEHILCVCFFSEDRIRSGAAKIAKSKTAGAQVRKAKKCFK